MRAPDAVAPIRILFATAETFPTHRPDVRVLFGETLPAHGVAVDLLAMASPDARPADWQAGRAHLGRASSRLGLLAGDLWQQISLLWRCGGGYRALVVRDKPVLGVIGFVAARLWRVRYFYWMSYPMPASYLAIARRPAGSIGRLRRAWNLVRGHLGQFILDRILVPRSDWLFVQSDEMLRSLRAHGLSHDRASAVPMGVDVDAIPAPAEHLPEALRGRRLGVYLGTLDRSRDPELLVDSAMRVAARHPDFTLLIVGEAEEPSDRGWLADYAKRAGSGQSVQFTGWVPYSDGLALARHALFGVSPIPRTPLTEVGSPTKAVEYIACGLPVVANDQPDQAHVVRESGGGVLVPLDADGLARGMNEILDDPGTFRARAVAARAWVASHRSYRVLGSEVARRMRDAIEAD